MQTLLIIAYIIPISLLFSSPYLLIENFAKNLLTDPTFGARMWKTESLDRGAVHISTLQQGQAAAVGEREDRRSGKDA